MSAPKFIDPHQCARTAYQAGVKVIQTDTLKRGRQTVAIALHYEGAGDALKGSNVIFTTARHRYAPEITRRVAVFFTKAEVKRRAQAAAAAAAEAVQ